MRRHEPVCWWCDEPERRAPLIEHRGCLFHRGRCRRDFDAHNPEQPSRSKPPTTARARKAPPRPQELATCA